MQISKSEVSHDFGHQLVDSISVPDSELNFLFAALFFSSIGVFIGGNLLLLDGSVLQYSAQIAFACFAILLIFYMLSRVTGSVTWGLVLIYGMMSLVVYSRQDWLIPAVYVVALVGLGYAVRFLRVQRNEWVLVLLMALLVIAVVLGVARAYTSFDMLNRLHVGNVEQDTLFHASIAAMIKNYGVTSTGLHGLVETPYHVLSHVLFAGISLLSGAGVFEVYGVANWVFFAPILIFSAVICSVMLDRAKQLSVPITWGIVCILLVISPILLRYWRVSDSFFVSESYLVSLGLFLLAFPFLFKRRLSLSDILLIVIVTALMSYAKTTVGMIFAGLWVVRIIFVRGERIRLELVTLASSIVVVALIIFDSAEASQGSLDIVPLHFIGQYSFQGQHLFAVSKALREGTGLPLPSVLLALVAVLSFFTFHFLLSWVVIGRTASKDGILAVFSSPLSVYTLAAVFAGAMIIILFRIPGGSAYYFSNVAFFVALPGVVALIALVLNRTRVSPALLLASGALLIGLLSVGSYYKASAFHPSRSSLQHSTLIDTLIELRQNKPMNLVLQPNSTGFANNPVSRCTAQPFVYPAISERPWVDVISIQNDCTYEYYGFGQYGITDSKQTVTIQPQLMPGMKVLRWSQATTNTK